MIRRTRMNKLLWHLHSFKVWKLRSNSSKQRKWIGVNVGQVPTQTWSSWTLGWQLHVRLSRRWSCGKTSTSLRRVGSSGLSSQLSSPFCCYWCAWQLLLQDSILKIRKRKNLIQSYVTIYRSRWIRHIRIHCCLRTDRLGYSDAIALVNSRK